MDFNKINLEQISSVRSYINYVSTKIGYKHKKKYFSFLFPKEGWYHVHTIGSDEFTTKEEIERSGELFCKDERVFFYPHITIKMNNGCTYDKFFKSKEELYSFMNSELKSIKWIEQ